MRKAADIREKAMKAIMANRKTGHWESGLTIQALEIMLTDTATIAHKAERPIRQKNFLYDTAPEQQPCPPEPPET